MPHALARGRREQVGAQRPADAVEAEALRRLLESAADHPGIGADAGLALAPGGIVELAAAGVADNREQVLELVRIVLRQPVAHDLLELVRQPQDRVAALAGWRRVASL